MIARDVILMMIMSIVLVDIIVIRIRKMQYGKGRLILFLPLAGSILHIMLFGYSYILLPLYMSAFFIAFLYLLWNKKIWFRIGSIIAILLIASQFIFLEWGKIRVSMTYTEEFEQTFQDMKENYILADRKGIDYEFLYKKYLPLFEKADREKDETLAYMAWLQYCYEFKDGHVAIFPLIQSDELIRKTRERMTGNDYGLSLLTLSNGQTVAILVDSDSDAYRAGIRNGTVIRKWNGTDIETIKRDIHCIYPGLTNFPVKENEEQYKSFFVAGTGEETIIVEFLDDVGNKKEVVLSANGSYAERLNQAIRLFQFRDKHKNLFWEIQPGGHGYLRLTQEIYGPISMLTGDYSACGKKIDEMITAMQEAGVKDLIIDLRNNIGGEDKMGMEIMSRFADQNQFYYADGVKTADGKYQITKEYRMQADMKWGNLPIILLVNSNCVSAGDGFTYNMGQLENVKIMGMSDTVGSFQATGGGSIMGEHGLRLGYPVIYQLGQDGSIMIDNGTDREAVVKRDIAIPINQNTVKQLFVQGKDYELNYVKEYLEKVPREQ